MVYSFIESRILSSLGVGVNEAAPRIPGEGGRWGAARVRLAATDSPTGEGSTIGAPGLNCSVRNGKR